MIKKKPYKNPRFHVDFADLEVELKKSIDKQRMTERLGQYVIKITDSVLLSAKHLRTYSSEDRDYMRFDIYEYIVNKLLKNYDLTRKSGFAFIKKMVLNRLAGTKRKIHTRGLNPERSINKFDRRRNINVSYTFLTISYDQP